MKLNKFSALLLASSIVFTGLFTSCNKKLKKDIKNQEQEIADLKAQQDATSSQLGNSPFTMNLTTKNDADSSMTVYKSYKCYQGPDYTNMSDNHDGTWNVYLYVTEVAYWDNEAYIGLTYNPTTKVVTNASMHLTYYDYQYNNKYVRLNQNDANTTATYTINQFDTNTGMFDITAIGSTNTSSSNNIYTGKAMDITFHYNGKLTVFK